MTKDDVTQVGYWIDLTAKGAIGVVMAIVGLDYRAVKDSLKDLEDKKYQRLQEVALLKLSLSATDTRLDRIEKKVDRILELAK